MRVPGRAGFSRSQYCFSSLLSEIDVRQGATFSESIKICSGLAQNKVRFDCDMSPLSSEALELWVAEFPSDAGGMDESFGLLGSAFHSSKDSHEKGHPQCNQPRG